MSSNEVIVLDCLPGLQHPGGTVSGTVDVNVDLARCKGVMEVVIKIVGELKTRVYNQARGVNLRADDTLLQLEQSLWKADDEPISYPHEPLRTGVSSFPFQFHIPVSDALPCSYNAYIENGSVSIQYYVKVVGIRPGLFKSNVRIVRPFPFVPIDNTPPPSILHEGTRSIIRRETICAGLIFREPLQVDAELVLPDLPTLPLFQKIPLLLRIQCSSKVLPQCSSKEFVPFKLPLPPTTPHALDLRLMSNINVVCQRNAEKGQRCHGLVGGLGSPMKKDDIKGWRDDVSIDLHPPNWIPEGDSKREGRWSQEVTFGTFMVLDCPVTIEQPHLKTQYFLRLQIPLPRLKVLKMDFGPVKITSGIHREGHVEHAIEPTLDLLPSYWEVVEDDRS